ncbi:MAG TPA: 4Fe-4S binding protein [Methylococcaceae bacterium]|nr:4Fe-4S binding protein [Methylococcaceae bacterium]
MAMFIVADECISCGDCEPVCPTNAITEAKTTFKIDKTTCTECEGVYKKPKCVTVCPVDGCIIKLAA